MKSFLHVIPSSTLPCFMQGENNAIAELVGQKNDAIICISFVKET